LRTLTLTLTFIKGKKYHYRELMLSLPETEYWLMDPACPCDEIPIGYHSDHDE
jgi:hypothetical protein